MEINKYSRSVEDERLNKISGILNAKGVFPARFFARAMSDWVATKTDLVVSEISSGLSGDQQNTGSVFFSAKHQTYFEYGDVAAAIDNGDDMVQNQTSGVVMEYPVEDVIEEMGDRMTIAYLTSAYYKALSDSFTNEADLVNKFNSYVQGYMGNITAGASGMYQYLVSILSNSDLSVTDKIAQHVNDLTEGSSNDDAITHPERYELSAYMGVNPVMAFLSSIQLSDVMSGVVDVLGAVLTIINPLLGIGSFLISRGAKFLVDGFHEAFVNPIDIEKIGTSADADRSIDGGLSDLGTSTMPPMLKDHFSSHPGQMLITMVPGATIYATSESENSRIRIKVASWGDYINGMNIHSALPSKGASLSADDFALRAVPLSMSNMIAPADNADEGRFYFGSLSNRVMFFRWCSFIMNQPQPIYDAVFDRTGTHEMNSWVGWDATITDSSSPVNNEHFAKLFTTWNVPSTGWPVQVDWSANQVEALLTHIVGSRNGFYPYLWRSAPIDPGYRIVTDAEHGQKIGSILKWTTITAITATTIVVGLKLRKKIQHKSILAQAEWQKSQIDPEATSTEVIANYKKAKRWSRVSGTNFAGFAAAGTVDIDAPDYTDEINSIKTLIK